VSLVVENRDPEDALVGDVLDRRSTEAAVHPLDVLRTFAGLPLGSVLEQRLDHLEQEAAAKAPLTRHAIDLVRALRDSGRPVSVVTDVGPAAVRRFLTHRFLDRVPLAGVHGRGDLATLMPDPDCVRRALRATDTPAAAGVVIGSSVAEFAATARAETRFIGYAPTTSAERHLRQAGCDVTVPSLEPLLEAARSL
jgi:beta-phosphoglucomutase-like phosphatase (HAD superfamily)